MLGAVLDPANFLNIQLEARILRNVFDRAVVFIDSISFRLEVDTVAVTRYDAFEGVVDILEDVA